MRGLFAPLLLMGLIAFSAQADPTILSGGVLITHYVEQLPYSSDAPTLGWCGEYAASYAISSFEDQVNRIDTQTYLPASWFVIAAWWEEKTWCGTEYGLGEFNAGLFGFLEWAACYPPGGGLEIPTAGWPGPNEGIAFVVTGEAWEGNFVPVMWFGGYAYGYAGAGIIPLGVDPPTAFAGFSNCAAPPEPFAVEPSGWGGMGINMDGIWVGPMTPDPGACCIGEDCSYILEEQCIALGGNFLGELIPCEPNPCLPPLGACCLPEPLGHCQEMSEAECLLMQGQWMGPETTCAPINPCTGEWVCCYGTPPYECIIVNLQSECDSLGGDFHPEWNTCEPNPCLPTPCKETSWGGIKSMYR